MKKIKYTPDAADKLRALKSAISGEYGGDKAKFRDLITVISCYIVLPLITSPHKGKNKGKIKREEL
ncbi:MAG: hypothetical protein PUE32_02475 [Clostridia bacterium]|nr:hypothetical protein [Clostridia bacterium]